MTAVPTAEQVRELLDYDPETGIFLWKQRRAPSSFKAGLVGQEAGTLHSRGYWCISVFGRKWLAHQLAWLHYYGVWPDRFVDHANLNKRDNRIANLRLASFAENSANANIRTDNTSGFRGVRFEPRRKRWIAVIEKDGTRRQLGSFTDKELAVAAYAKGASALFGDFCPEYVRSLG